MSFVTIDKLTFRYKKEQAPVINNFHFTMNKGEIVGISGTSGSGKSTLLRLVAGLEIPESGDILIGQCLMVSGLFCMDVEKRGVGMVFQDYALFPHLTVSDNISFGLHKFSRAERRTRLKEMLELVQMTEYSKRYPHELSGGQQQRVSLARSLAPKPSILLMDEPFSNLDTELKSTIRSELRDILRAENMTCLFVSHDPEDIEAICDRSIRMEAQLVAMSG